MLTEEQAKVKYLKYKQKYLELKASLENEQIGGTYPVGFPNNPGTAVGFPNENDPTLSNFFLSPLGMALISTAAYVGYQGVKKATNWLFGSTPELPEQIVDELVADKNPSEIETEEFFDAVENVVNNEQNLSTRETIKIKFNNLLSGIYSRGKLALPTGGNTFVAAATKRLPPEILEALKNPPQQLKSVKGSALDQLIAFQRKPVTNPKEYSRQLNGLLLNYIESVTPSSPSPSPSPPLKVGLQEVYNQIRSDPTKQKYFIENVEQITKQPF
jgi:hypothetical protein